MVFAGDFFIITC